MKSKVYPLEKSPLYRLRNRKKLALLLELEENYFKNTHEYQYKEFQKPKSSGDGFRKFAEPKGEIRKIQKKLLKYLKRIETPNWLKSGKKSESYITNCELHKDAKFVRTMDICHFYDAVSYQQIVKSLCEIFCMETDIARIIAKLVTHKKVIPTGSPSSQLIVYWIYKEMFDEINRISESYGCKFSLYVDDMTFSSQELIPRKLRDDVVKVLNRYSLHAKRSKDHYYQFNTYIVVTGCGIKDGEIDVPNKQRHKIIEQFKLCQKTDSIAEIEKLNGMMCSVRQMDATIFPSINQYLLANEDRLKEYVKERSRKNLKRKRKSSGRTR